MPDSAPDFMRETELALLNAPFEDKGWEAALDKLSRACGARGSHLVCVGSSLPSSSLLTGYDEDVMEALANPVLWGQANWRVGSSTGTGAIQHDGDYDLYRERFDCSDYDEIVDDIDMPFGCQTIFLQDAAGFVGLALMRGRQDGRCDQGTMARFARLSAVASRAFKLQLALDGQAAQTMLGDIASSACATFLLDRHGVVCAASELADRLRAADGLFDTGSPALTLRDARDDRSFQRLLARLIGVSDIARSPLTGEIRVGTDVERPNRMWRLIVSRLPAREHGLGFEPHVAVTVSPL